MEKKSIVYQGQIIEFGVEYKRVKNINIRVLGDLSVVVSTSKSIGDEELKDLLMGKAEWILHAQAVLTERMAKKMSTKRHNDYTGGGRIAFWGEYIRLYFSQKGDLATVFRDGALWIHGYTEQTDVKALVEQFYYEQCEQAVAELHEKIYPIFAPYGVPKAQIRLKKLVASWGRCSSNDWRIVLNWQLVKADRACLEAVFFHEYCHFIHPNHSKEFYKLLDRLVPDHRVLKKLAEATVELRE